MLSRARALVLALDHPPRRLGRCRCARTSRPWRGVVLPPGDRLARPSARASTAASGRSAGSGTGAPARRRDTENQYLRSRMPSSTSSRSKIGHWCRNRRYSSGVQKPITRSTPARLYQDRSISTISPGRRQMLDVALEVPLAALALGRRGQRDDPGDPRIEVLGDPLDRRPLARRVPALEDHHEPGALGPDPLLHGRPARPAAGTAPVRRPSSSATSTSTVTLPP